VTSLGLADEVSSLTFYDDGPIALFRNTLLATARSTGQLMQLTPDARDATRISSVRPVVGAPGPLRAVAVDSDGVVYVATATAVLRLDAATDISNQRRH
jgi:glucose/arabinose dehydrogenase